MRRTAFTLVELLVVITIIIVLLALLSPAMNKAIYRAELAVCGTHLRGIHTSVTIYAMDNRRHYPYRAGVHERTQTSYYTPASLSHGEDNVTKDDRELLKSIMPINKILNDPTLPALDFESAAVGSWVWVPYNLWFGFQYYNQPSDPRKGVMTDRGMFRLGDALEFSNRGADPVRKFRVIASDLYFTRETNIDIASAHPDRDDLLAPVALQDGESSAEKRVEYVDPDRLLTYSRWEAYGTNRLNGPVDLNFVFDHGGVVLIDNIDYYEPQRMERVDRVALTSRSGAYPQQWNMIAR
jgi:competence protein ComGC